MGAAALPAALMVALQGLGGCAPPTAVAVEPVCRRGEVVDFVAAELRRRDLYAELLPGTAAERTSLDGRASSCAAYARWTVFDSTRPGRAPEVFVRPVFYGVRRAEQGFVVDVLPPGPLLP